MPPTIAYAHGDVVLVGFVFSDIGRDLRGAVRRIARATRAGRLSVACGEAVLARLREPGATLAAP